MQTCTDSAKPGEVRKHNFVDVRRRAILRHSHREPAAHVKIVEDLEAAGARLQVLSLQRKGVERPRGSVRSLYLFSRDRR